MITTRISALGFALWVLASIASAAGRQPYVVATGKLVIEQYQPDGDSIRFIADHPEVLTAIRREELLKPSRRDRSVQLRLEGIDAPETHFHQFDQPFGIHARDALLARLGFTNVDFGKKGKTVLARAEN